MILTILTLSCVFVLQPLKVLIVKEKNPNIRKVLTSCLLVN